MDKITIFWTQTAILQRDLIFHYWNIRNKSNFYSKELNLTIRERIEILKSNPEIGIETTFGKVRSISMGNYRILYLVNDNKIIIMGFWDNRQDPERLLTFLKDKPQNNI